jgi:hypothetical protein
MDSVPSLQLISSSRPDSLRNESNLEILKVPVRIIVQLVEVVFRLISLSFFLTITLGLIPLKIINLTYSLGSAICDFLTPSLFEHQNIPDSLEERRSLALQNLSEIDAQYKEETRIIQGNKEEAQRLVKTFLKNINGTNQWSDIGSTIISLICERTRGRRSVPALSNEEAYEKIAQEIVKILFYTVPSNFERTCQKYLIEDLFLINRLKDLLLENRPFRNLLVSEAVTNYSINNKLKNLVNTKDKSPWINQALKSYLVLSNALRTSQGNLNLDVPNERVSDKIVAAGSNCRELIEKVNVFWTRIESTYPAYYDEFNTYCSYLHSVLEKKIDEADPENKLQAHFNYLVILGTLASTDGCINQVLSTISHLIHFQLLDINEESSSLSEMALTSNAIAGLELSNYKKEIIKLSICELLKPQRGLPIISAGLEVDFERFILVELAEKLKINDFLSKRAVSFGYYGHFKERAGKVEEMFNEQIQLLSPQECLINLVTMLGGNTNSLHKTLSKFVFEYLQLDAYEIGSDPNIDKIFILASELDQNSLETPERQIVENNFLNTFRFSPVGAIWLLKTVGILTNKY